MKEIAEEETTKREGVKDDRLPFVVLLIIRPTSERK